METVFQRLEWLIGKDKVADLATKSVLVFGCGGVGSYAIEALARGGIGRLVIVDGDVVAVSNINRQLIALPETVGMRKVQAEYNRVKQIRPDMVVEAHDMVYTKDIYPEFIEEAKVDFIVDAIDMVTAKIQIAEEAKRLHIPMIMSMGCGNKLHPELLTLADIKKTHTCRLARVMRRELRKRQITSLPVVYSPEPVITPVRDEDSKSPGTISVMPSVAGLIMAGYVLRQLEGLDK